MKNIYDKFMGLFYFCFICALFYTSIVNIINPWPIIMVSIFILISFSTRYLIFSEIRNLKLIKGFLIFGELSCVFIISYIDIGNSSIFFYLIICAEALLNYNVKWGIAVLLGGFSFNAIGIVLKCDYNPSSYLPGVLYSSLSFIGVCFVVYIIRYFIKQNVFIEQTLEKLTIKTLEQELMYKELIEAYERLEDVTILKERNKIAREIHDTVGHTLTTVLVEMELGKKLIIKNKALGIQNIEQAQERVREGLKDIRNSVRILGTGNELLDFIPSMESLLKETIEHTGVTIKWEMDQFPTMDSTIKKTLYRALQEGLTNGLKHGNSTVFIFKLLFKDNKITFLLMDNGSGTSTMNFGFGLNAMKERIKEQGGTMNVESSTGEGFNLYIDIPIKV